MSRGYSKSLDIWRNMEISNFMGRQSTDANAETTQLLELSDKVFKAATIKMLQQVQQTI